MKWFEDERPWSRRQAAAWILAGAVGLLACPTAGPWAGLTWLAPAAVTSLCVRATGRELRWTWLALTLAGAAPHFISWWPAAPGVAVGLTVGIGLDLALMLAGGRYLAARGTAFTVIVGVAALRVVIEQIWCYTPAGQTFSWGFGLVSWPSLRQVMVYGGLASLSFVMVLSGSSVGLLLAQLNRPGALRMAAGSASLLAILAGIGMGRFDRGSTEVLKVGVAAAPGGPLRRLADLTRTAGTQGCGLVVWPADSASLQPSELDDLLPRFGDLARDGSLWLMMGSRSAGETAILVATPLGLPERRVVKVPEPRPWSLLTSDAETTWEARGAKFGGLAALFDGDVMFPLPALTASRSGATVLALPFGLSPVARTQIGMARVRAIENGAAVVVAGGAQGSWVFDALGQVAAASVPPDVVPLTIAEVAIERTGSLLAAARLRFPWVMTLLLVFLFGRAPVRLTGEQEPAAGR